MVQLLFGMSRREESRFDLLSFLFLSLLFLRIDKVGNTKAVAKSREEVGGVFCFR